MIISGPALSKKLQGEINHGKAYVKDLAPTILSLAGIDHPGNKYQGKTIEPSTGINLHPIISGITDNVYSENDIIAYEIGGNAALIKGDYKISLNRGEYNDSQWHLYNITLDPGETNELEKIQPGIFSDLLHEYHEYVKENGVIAVPEGYIQTRQAALNGIKARFGAQIAFLFFAFVSFIIFVIYRYAKKR
jgi:arylsulfatase A-like enzyme